MSFAPSFSGGLRPLGAMLVAAWLGLGCGLSQAGLEQHPVDAGDGDAGTDAGDPDLDAGPPACGCMLGEGQYCGARAMEEAARRGCQLPFGSGRENLLLNCENNQWTAAESCEGRCAFTSGSPELDDACVLPPCECFVQETYCGSSAAAKAKERKCQVPLLPEHTEDILGCDGSAWVVKQSCEYGCLSQPSGGADSCRTSSLYALPFECGRTYRCSQGNHGDNCSGNTGGHRGKDEYAYDLALPQGTPVRAMRAGKVLAVRNVSPPGSLCYNGGGTTCANKANTVQIRHADGTVALYMHLNRGTATVGRDIEQGEVLGNSGNSGYSAGPQLHVQVQGDCGSWWCQSIPFHFGDAPALACGTEATSANRCR